MTSISSQIAVGRVLKHWRGVRGLSQLQLAMEAEVSARHVSFIETGRSQPSRPMLLRLADALALPLRQSNALLTAAGYSAYYRETPLDGEALKGARGAVEHILNAMAPHGAVALDRHWNALSANAPFQNLLGFFLGADFPQGQTSPHNMYELMFHKQGLWRFIDNWSEIAGHLLRRLRAETLDGRNDEGLQELFTRMAASPQAPDGWHLRGGIDVAGHDDETPPFMTLSISKGDIHLSLLTTITTFGIAQDITLQEIRIETFHPADDTSALLLKKFADG